MSTNISTIIPAYNESDNIENLLKKIREIIKSNIIIIDDSSNNLTKSILIKKKN